MSVMPNCFWKIQIPGLHSLIFASELGDGIFILKKYLLGLVKNDVTNKKWFFTFHIPQAMSVTPQRAIPAVWCLEKSPEIQTLSDCYSVWTLRSPSTHTCCNSTFLSRCSYGILLVIYGWVSFGHLWMCSSILIEQLELKENGWWTLQGRIKYRQVLKTWNPIRKKRKTTDNDVG